MSDERLPVEILDPASMTTVEGRVLVHGQDENTGRNYLMLEATDAKVYFVHYTREMEEARSRGELRTNSFVRLKKLNATLMDVTDLGDAERLLHNPLHLADAARECLKRGVAPVEEGWGGWLGRYQAALSQKVHEIVDRGSRSARGDPRTAAEQGSVSRSLKRSAESIPITCWTNSRKFQRPRRPDLARPKNSAIIYKGHAKRDDTVNLSPGGSVC